MHDEIRQMVPRVIRDHALGIDTDFAMRLADVFLGAFGRRFFEEQRRSTDSISGAQKWDHPLVDNIMTPKAVDAGIIEMLELARYIETFSNDAAIRTILENLRAPRQYNSTLFQIAMAFRLSQFCHELSLEPKTTSGYSDIRFVYGGKTVIAECYRLKMTYRDVMGRVESGISEFLFRSVPDGRSYCFFLTIGELLTNARLSHLKRELLSAIRELKRCGSSRRLEVAVGKHRIDIQDITDLANDPDFPPGAKRPIRLDQADACFVQSFVPASNIFRAFGSRPINRLPSRVFIKRLYSQEAVKGPRKTLESKLTRKLAQTQTNDNASSRALLVELPILGTRIEGAESDDSLRSYTALVDYSSRNVSRFAFLLLATRHITSNIRFEYDARVMKGDGEHALPERFVQEFALHNAVDMLRK